MVKSNRVIVGVSVLVATFSLALSACMPSHLAKYQKKDVTPSQSSSRFASSPDNSTNSSSRESAGDLSKQNRPEKATIYAVDRQTYRFTLKEDDIWDSALQVLLKNYNLTIVDRTSGIVTTEWDTFYIRSAIYRNKVSMRVRRLSRDIVEVTIRNNVERLQDGSAAGTVGAVWLPGEDPGNEVVRVVQNMALALNQPPPVIPPDQVARGLTPATRGGGGSSR